MVKNHQNPNFDTKRPLTQKKIFVFNPISGGYSDPHLGGGRFAHFCYFGTKMSLNMLYNINFRIIEKFERIGECIMLPEKFRALCRKTDFYGNVSILVLNIYRLG